MPISVNRSKKRESDQPLNIPALPAPNDNNDNLKVESQQPLSQPPIIPLPIGGNGDPAKEDKAGVIEVAGVSHKVILAKREDEYLPLMYLDSEVDRVASLIGLVMMGVMADGSKMKRRNNCFAAESPSMAASKWVPKAVNSSYLPDLITKQIHRIDRSFTDDTREDLGFLGHCITYVHKLYPEKTDQKMAFIWKHVREGIIALKRQYKTEPPTPLTQKMVEKWASEGLTTEMSFDDMFDKWIAQVESYYEERNIPQQTNNVNNIEYLPEPIAANLTNALTLIKESKIEGQQQPETLEDLEKVIHSILVYGKVPKKLCPLSEKIRELWSKDDIHKLISDIETLGRERDLTVKNVKLEEMIEEIEKTANQYATIVRNEMIEVMSL